MTTQVSRDPDVVGISADDVANMAEFPASDGAATVSARIITVDGHTEDPSNRLDK